MRTTVRAAPLAIGDGSASVESGGGRGGDRSGGHGSERVGPGWHVQITRVEVEVDVDEDGFDGDDGGAGGDEVEVDGAGAGGLVDEAHGDLAGWARRRV